MNYPLISEYIESIRYAEDNFATLTNLRPVLDNNGNPIMSSGNFAVVFKMKDIKTNKIYAVKCFLKEQEGREQSYQLIAEELEDLASNYLTSIRYMKNELFVDSANSNETEFPVLLMEWIEGVTLDKYIRTHIESNYGLAMLVYRFSKLASWLLSQPFAHGDLKLDNILVKEDGSLVLVDYDGMYVPAMKGQKAREIGSPDFRHPQRTEEQFDEYIDDFAIASILLSLKAISLTPQLLSQYGATDRLLFSQKDYSDLSSSNAIDALRPLMADSELNLLYSLFLLAHSKQDLSMISFRLLTIAKPKKPSKFHFNIFEELLARKWTITSVRKFTREEIELVAKAQVVESEYGASCCFFMKDGTTIYQAMSNDSKANVGDILKMSEIEIVTLEKEGCNPIERIRG